MIWRDAIDRWLAECCQRVDGSNELTSTLHDSWHGWAQRNGVPTRSVRRFAFALRARRIDRWRHPRTRRMGFADIRLRATAGVPCPEDRASIP